MSLLLHIFRPHRKCFIDIRELASCTLHCRRASILWDKVLFLLTNYFKDGAVIEIAGQVQSMGDCLIVRSLNTKQCYQISIPTTLDQRVARSTTRSNDIHYSGHEGRLQPHLDEERRGVENSVQDTLWSIRIPGHAVWAY